MNDQKPKQEAQDMSLCLMFVPPQCRIQRRAMLRDHTQDTFEARNYLCIRPVFVLISF
jgi:hypothetical protein